MVPTPDEERLYPKGVVSKALQNLAFQDDGLIQYKAEVMLRVFEKEVAPLIGGFRPVSTNPYSPVCSSISRCSGATRCRRSRD